IFLQGAYQTASGTYFDTLAAANGCDSIITITLTVNPAVTSTILDSICQGDSILLGGSWQTTAGTYNDTITNGSANSCDSIIITTLTVMLVTDASILSVNIFCENDPSIDLQAVTGGGIWIGTGIVDSAIGSFDPSAAGTGSNQIIYTIAGSCGDADTVQITVDPMPAATATAAEPIINLGEGTWLNGSGGTSYQWTPADGLGCATCLSTAANPQETTTYLLTVTDSNGCVSFDSVTVVIVQNPCGGEVFVPNVFTPNGDGENDKVYVFGKCIESMLFAIYDRWGNKIYESSDQSQGWDGTKQGKEFNNGVYVYMLNAVLQNEETVKLKGNITLLK
ncbi:MAG TPA: gliding motility-associated C-terminal domain-containing protein, partial [Flavobacteriales bacterium]|nr:gliding motility-associated C-terminal domain-containing protein [Flavobacteriales bacterium]